jgi:hypothetical protein
MRPGGPIWATARCLARLASPSQVSACGPNRDLQIIPLRRLFHEVSHGLACCPKLRLACLTALTEGVP